MLTVNKYSGLLQEWFYLDIDDITIRRAKNGYYGRYKKGDVVNPYTLCSYGYRGIHVPTTRTTVSLHHLLTLLRGIKIPDNAVIDHVDGNSENNHRCNIRVTTQCLNAKNQKRRKNNTTGITGINWNQGSNSYVVRKMLQGKRHYLGQRKTLKEAKQLLDSYSVEITADGYTKRHGK